VKCFSALILTKNEEDDLPGCLHSLAAVDDIVIFDSLSTDRTKEIALEAGSRFIVRPGFDGTKAFDGNEAQHRTWGIRNIEYKNPWLLVIDADERLTSEASEELQGIASNPDAHYVAYRIRRRDFFQARHLRFAQMSPWYIRFFRPEFVYYERLVNPITVVEGPIANLRNHLDHYPFSKGVGHWLCRHNTYSDFESLEISTKKQMSTMQSLAACLLSQSPEKQRGALKALYYTLPMRPLIKFIYIYFLRLGFLDGRPGLTYSLLIAFYELIIAIKVQEIENR
jgi:glycosyltransferase involved in cell wall biosynthesis